MQTSNALTPRPYQTLALKRHTHCTNCGSPLNGNFCHDCGQRDIDFQQDWGELVEEVYTSVFRFDGKILKGMMQLLFKPGFVTGQYLQGKRVSQAPPIRFYLFVGLLFFLTMWIQNFDSFSLNASADVESTAPVERIAQSEVTRLWMSPNTGNVSQIYAILMNWLPNAFLIGTPILAFISWFIFYRQPVTYIEHLVIVIHMQTFVMLWQMFTLGWGELIGLVSDPAQNWFTATTSIWLWIYPIITIRKVFGTPWWKTILSGIAIECFWVCYIILSLFAILRF